jgi:hypothetical protein
MLEPGIWIGLESAYGCYRQGHIISVSFGVPRLETRYVEIKHKGNRGIKTLSKETHTV